MATVSADVVIRLPASLDAGAKCPACFVLPPCIHYVPTDDEPVNMPCNPVRRCGACGEPGHYASTCKERP